MDNREKAQRLMSKGVDPQDVGNPKVRQIMKNYYRENYRQQVAQATALNPSGLPENMSAAAPQSFNPLGQGRPQNYTWQDGDTLNTVASQFNTTPNELLDANPDMRTPQTGMVINTYNPNVSDQERYANTRGVRFDVQGKAFKPLFTFAGLDIGRMYNFGANGAPTSSGLNPFTGYWWGIKIGNPKNPPRK